MAEPDVTSPLLHKDRFSDPSNEPRVFITIDDDRGSESLNHSIRQEPPIRPDNENDEMYNTRSKIDNPFEFIGGGELAVPTTTTIDPFRNHTRRIEGVYEWLKIVICVPIAIIRLVLFGLALSIGYVATKVALLGWKDKESPMPKWRGRLMWVTRICARCILFSFGYHWIKRRGQPAPRETAPIVVSNHVSYVEPIFFFYEIFPTIVASESHDSIPVVGTIIRAMQVIYVNRFSTSSRKHAVSEIKLFDTEMCFQGTEHRERLLPIDFLVCFYFLREPQQMESSSFLSKLVHLSLDILSSQSLFAIPMYTLTNPGGIFLWQGSCLECSHSSTTSWR